MCNCPFITYKWSIKVFNERQSWKNQQIRDRNCRLGWAQSIQMRSLWSKLNPHTGKFIIWWVARVWTGWTHPNSSDTLRTVVFHGSTHHRTLPSSIALAFEQLLIHPGHNHIVFITELELVLSASHPCNKSMPLIYSGWSVSLFKFQNFWTF